MQWIKVVRHVCLQKNSQFEPLQPGALWTGNFSHVLGRLSISVLAASALWAGYFFHVLGRLSMSVWTASALWAGCFSHFLGRLSMSVCWAWNILLTHMATKFVWNALARNLLILYMGGCITSHSHNDYPTSEPHYGLTTSKIKSFALT